MNEFYKIIDYIIDGDEKRGKFMESGTVLLMLITIILILVGLVKKNSLILFILQLLWMYILTAGNFNSADMMVHQNIFIASQSGENQTIYGALCYLFGHEGFDFIGMHAVLCIFAFISIYYFIKKYTLNYCFVMSLYFLYPFIDNVIQRRFFIASIVAIYAIIFIMKNSRLSKLVAIFLLVIAGLIHQAAFGFLIFLLLPFFKRMKNYKTILMVFFIVVLGLMPIMPDIFKNFFGEAKVELYFLILHEKIKYPIFNFILWGGFHLGFVYLYYNFYKICNNYIKEMEFEKNVLYINIISILIIPLYYWEPTFIRIYRTLIIFNYIAIANILPIGQIYYRPVFYVGLKYIVYSVIAFICIYFFAGAGYIEIVEPIFSNNILIDIF